MRIRGHKDCEGNCKGAYITFSHATVNLASRTRGPPLFPVVVGDFFDRCGRGFISRTEGNSFYRRKFFLRKNFLRVRTCPRRIAGHRPWRHDAKPTRRVVQHFAMPSYPLLCPVTLCNALPPFATGPCCAADLSTTSATAYAAAFHLSHGLCCCVSST